MSSIDQNIFHVMKERASVRKYIEGYDMPNEDIREILEAATLAPSSWNLQHWKFIVITDQEKKEQILPIAFNQEQIVQSSAVIAVLGDLEANKNVDAVYDEAVEKGFMLEKVKETLANQINGAYQNEQFARDEAFLNTGFASMQLMLAAKAKGYDTCPMGGFDKKKFAEQFDVPDRYVPVMLLSLGKAKEEAHKTARFPVEDTITKWY